MSATILVTGANRGLGRNLLAAYLLRPETTAIAGVRDTEIKTSKSLLTLPKAHSSRLIIVKINSSSDTDALDAVKLLRSAHGIERLDIVIASAGIANYIGIAVETPLSEIKDHFQVNVMGPMSLFQATWPLLKESSDAKYIILTSSIASMGDMESMPIPALAYGISKVSVNYMIRKIHFEHPTLITLASDPGFVQTDMGNRHAKMQGLTEAPNTIDESVTGIMSQIDNATKSNSGESISFSGSKITW